MLKKAYSLDRSTRVSSKQSMSQRIEIAKRLISDSKYMNSKKKKKILKFDLVFEDNSFRRLEGEILKNQLEKSA